MTEATRRPLVLIAGGGVAALEAALALEKLAGARVRLELLAPSREFVFRPLLVAEPFGRGVARRVPLRDLLGGRPVQLVADGLARVEPAEQRLHTTGGSIRGYDALLVACGARAAPALPGALSFDGSDGVRAYRALLGELRRGRVSRVVFALPWESGWALPLYELALLTAAHLTERRVSGVTLEVVTHEPAPLAAFGEGASRYLAGLLARNGIGVRTAARPRAVTDGALVLADGDSVAAERVVALPRPVGPRIAGLPHDQAGFLPVDEHGRVPASGEVYAAGDATTWPLKQGGLAAQQADVAAASIAAWAGAPVQAAPFRPVLRGLLLTGEQPVFLRAEGVGSEREKSVASRGALWWPTGKIAGRYLTSHLEAHGEIRPPPGVRKLVAIIAASGGDRAGAGRS
jgi:sulfide:quinone oxidoreductase